MREPQSFQGLHVPPPSSKRDFKPPGFFFFFLFPTRNFGLFFRLLPGGRGEPGKRNICAHISNGILLCIIEKKKKKKRSSVLGIA